MKQPLTFARDNLVFGRTPDDAWAVYSVRTEAYVGLTATGKRDVLTALAGFAFNVGRDFQILRVSRPWSVDAYSASAAALADERFAHADQLASYLAGHGTQLGARRVARPEVFVAASLRSREQGLSGLGALLSSMLALRAARGISALDLDRLRDAERGVFATACDFLDCLSATTDQIQWLIQRAFVRAIAEPELDSFWMPQALVIDTDEPGPRYLPLEADVLRLCDAPIEIGPRHLTVHAEAGASHQAFLALGGLPEVVRFPGHQAELLFAPLEPCRSRLTPPSQRDGSRITRPSPSPAGAWSTRTTCTRRSPTATTGRPSPRLRAPPLLASSKSSSPLPIGRRCCGQRSGSASLREPQPS